MKLSHYFEIFGLEIDLNFRILKKRTKKISGYTNKCMDGKYILTLDYDNQELEWIIEELQQIQQLYELSTILIFKSSETGYHAVCFDKLTMQEWYNILKVSSADYWYKTIPLKYGKRLWTLRCSDKSSPIYLVKVLTSYCNKRQLSKAHYKAVTNIFKLKHLKEFKKANFDNLNNLILAKYTVQEG